MKNISYQNVFNYVKSNFSDNQITPYDLDAFKDIITKENIILSLKEILCDDELAHKIASRSYSHTLGFDKIVLVDLAKDVNKELPKVQLRLHIWEPDNLSVPIVESLHEHSFDFISHVLTGNLENQIFSVDNTDNNLDTIFNKIKLLYQSISNDEKSFINSQVEIIEAIKLQTQGSTQLTDLYMLENYNLDRLIEITGFTEIECFQLASIQGRYVSNRVRGENTAYKHIFTENKQVYPSDVNHHDEGAYYFHSYLNPHRLYYDNSVTNSTILITTPTPLNPQGGSFQRPTYIESEEINYDKIKINLNDFKLKIFNLIEILEEKHIEYSLTNYEYKCLLEDITSQRDMLTQVIDTIKYEKIRLENALIDKIDLEYHTLNHKESEKELLLERAHLKHLMNVKNNSKRI
jgi:hypothetical protein